MSATNVTTFDGRPALQFERHLKHSRDKVWRAVTDPRQLSQWYPFRVTGLEPRTGGRMTFDDGEGTIYSATITDFDPPRLFAFDEHDPDGKERSSTIISGSSCATKGAAVSWCSPTSWPIPRSPTVPAEAGSRPWISSRRSSTQLDDRPKRRSRPVGVSRGTGVSPAAWWLTSASASGSPDRGHSNLNPAPTLIVAPHGAA